MGYIPWFQYPRHSFLNLQNCLYVLHIKQERKVVTYPVSPREIFGIMWQQRFWDNVFAVSAYNGLNQCKYNMEDLKGEVEEREMEGKGDREKKNGVKDEWGPCHPGSRGNDTVKSQPNMIIEWNSKEKWSRAMSRQDNWAISGQSRTSWDKWKATAGNS